LVQAYIITCDWPFSLTALQTDFIGTAAIVIWKAESELGSYIEVNVEQRECRLDKTGSE
jgi:hypothetical protein